MTTKTTDPKTDVSKRAEKRRRPMLRFAFWTFIGTAGVLTAAAGGAAWLVGTESGRSAALNLAVRSILSSHFCNTAFKQCTKGKDFSQILFL